MRLQTIEKNLSDMNVDISLAEPIYVALNREKLLSGLQGKRYEHEGRCRRALNDLPGIALVAKDDDEIIKELVDLYNNKPKRDVQRKTGAPLFSISELRESFLARTSTRTIGVSSRY